MTARARDVRSAGELSSKRGIDERPRSRRFLQGQSRRLWYIRRDQRMAGIPDGDEAVALIQTGHATAKREPGISNIPMNGEEGITKTLTKTTTDRRAMQQKVEQKGDLHGKERRRRSTARTTCRSTAAVTRGMKEVGTTHGVYGRLFGVLAWVEMGDRWGGASKRRRGERGERLLYAGTTRHEASGPARRKDTASTAALVDSWETTFPIGKVKQQTTTRRESERSKETPRRSADAAGERDRGTTAGGANSLDEPMASERASVVRCQPAASGQPGSIRHPATTRTFDPDDIDIPLPLNPRRHQLITNLPDTFYLITTASRTPIIYSARSRPRSFLITFFDSITLFNSCKLDPGDSVRRRQQNLICL